MHLRSVREPAAADGHGAPDGSFLWRQLVLENSKSGFGYRNEAGAARGLTTVKLRAGAAGRAQVEAQGTECRQTTYAMATVDVSSELSAKEP